MSNAAPPAWVRELALPSGAWRCLVGLWGFAKYGAEAPAQVWPARETLALATGQKAATVAKQLRKLADLGWLARAPNGVLWLAWRIPWSSGRIPWSSDTPVVGPTTTVTGPDTPVVASRRPQSSHNLQEPSKELPTNVEEAREREPLPPPPRHQAAQASLVTGKPSSRPWLPPAPQTAEEQAIVWGSQASAQAQLERERAAKLDETHALLDACIVDAWAAQVREASPGAHYLLDQTATSTHKASYSALMRQARASYGDQGVLDALRKWELADYTERPPAKALWHSRWTSWVEGVLDIKPPEQAKAAGPKLNASGQSALAAALQVVR